MTTPLSKKNVPIPKIQRFENFFRLFEEKPGVFKYLEEINDIIAKGSNSLVILYEDLLAFDPPLAELLRKDPQTLLEDAIEAFKNILKFQGATISDQDYFVRITTKDEKSPLAINLRSLRAKHIDQLIWTKGILVRSSVIRPKLVKASFECSLCGAKIEIPQFTSKIRWPKFCQNKTCKAKSQSDFRLISKNSEFIDWQSIMIQEIPEDLPPGRIPRSIQAILKYDLVDMVKPGDRVKLMGIYKSVLAQSPNSMNSNLFKTYIDVNYIDPDDKSDDIIELSKEDKEIIEKLSKEPMIQKKIARSIAPTIFGRDDLKMATALSLFAGTRKKKPGGGHKRGDIHVLFVGDPGTGKSVLGSEEIYLGIKSNDKVNWKTSPIGDFIDKIIEKNRSNLFKRADTEIVRFSKSSPFFTLSLNSANLKTRVTRIKEVSRHKANFLVRIETQTGRSIIATPNHSFITIKDGKLFILAAEDIVNYYEKKVLYLPIARKIDLQENFNNIDLTDFLSENELISSQTIKQQISFHKNKEVSLNTAAKNSNIMRGTLLIYEKKPQVLPNGDYIRTKYDNSWIPRFLPLNEKFGRIIGFYLSEGDVLKNSIRIKNTNNEIIDLLKNDFIEILGRVKYYASDDTIQFHSGTMSKLFVFFFGTHAYHKKISSIFLSTPKAFRKGLLSAYFTGDGYIEKEDLYIEATTASKRLAYTVSDLLSTFGIFSSIGRKIIKSGKYKGNIYYNIILTGEEVIKFYNRIGFLSTKKQRKLEKAILISRNTSRYQKKDIIPNFGNILQKITSDLDLISRRNTWMRNFLAELRGKTQRQKAGRLYLKKIATILEDLYEEKNKPLNKDLIWLKSLTNSDILWDPIKHIEIISKNVYVYDIATEDQNFIIAKGNLIVHNSEILKHAIEVSPRGLYTSGKGSTAVGLTAAVIKDSDTGQMNLEAGAVVLANGGVAAIDEFDKMNPADRSALHEAMEQQSFHYSTEILTADGKRITIGEYVDKILENNKRHVIKGIDCEILQCDHLSLYTTDFSKIMIKKVNRISRHVAPNYYYKITFSNGRSIIVTPEHPIYVLRDGKIKCIDASSCKKKDIIPLPKYLPSPNIDVFLQDLGGENRKNFRKIIFPQKITSNLARFLGYLASYHLYYSDENQEIIFSKYNKKIIQDFRVLIDKIFNIKVKHRIHEKKFKIKDESIKKLISWLKLNFPDLLKKNEDKRIPSNIFLCKKDIISEFLLGSFQVNLEFNGTFRSILVSNEKIGNDFQDLFLTLGIQTKLIHDKQNNTIGIRINEEDLYLFTEKILKFDKELTPTIKKVINHYNGDSFYRNKLPVEFYLKINEIKKSLNFDQHSVLTNFSNKMQYIDSNIVINEIEKIKISLNGNKSIGINLNIGRKNFLITCISNENINKVIKETSEIEKLIKSDLKWGYIENIERIQNEGKFYQPWVYDLTIEPSHSFISQGVILHNTVSIAKAGIIATLKAQTAIIAAANPRTGRYDRYKTPTQNINLPPSLLSRFDLIFVVIDRPDPAEDAQMAEFILKNSMYDPDKNADDYVENIAPIPPDLLKKYIKHARRTCFPTLTNEAKERIKQFYLELRGQYDSEDAIVSILARNLDALVRLSEAHAKMALREKVLKSDVEEIIKLFKRYLKDTGYDENTGKIDMDRILVGQSRSVINKLDRLLSKLKEIFEEVNWRAIEKSNAIQIISLEENLDEKWVENAIEELIKEGTLYEPRNNLIKLVNKEE